MRRWCVEPEAGTRWGCFCRWLGFGSVVLFLLSGFTPVPNWIGGWMTPAARLEAGDAIVVLGAGVDKAGAQSDRSLRRTVRGVSLYARGLAPLLVLSGYGRDGGPTEAHVAAELALLLGVAREAIVQEERGRTTREEAIHIGAILRSRGARRILLVTDTPHLRRAQLLFEAQGFDVLPAPADNQPAGATYPQARLQLMRDVAQEAMALLYYRLAGFISEN